VAIATGYVRDRKSGGANMSELSRRLTEEEDRLSRIAIERLAEANRVFDADVTKIVWPPEPKRKRVSLWKEMFWVACVALVLYACVWGILAL
jgi:hypothetical protein